MVQFSYPYMTTGTGGRVEVGLGLTGGGARLRMGQDEDINRS